MLSFKSEAKFTLYWVVIKRRVAKVYRTGLLLTLGMLFLEQAFAPEQDYFASLVKDLILVTR